MMARPGSAYVGMVLILLLALRPQAFGQPGPELVGAWGPLLDFDEGNDAAVLLKNGKILLAGGPSQTNFNDYLIYDPALPVSPGTNPLRFDGPAWHDLHCIGFSALTDGRVLFAGGNHEQEGLRETTIFDSDLPYPECWVRQDDSSARRWYPTCTALADGRILVTAGWDTSQGDNLANIPMIFDATMPSGQQWSELTGAECCTYDLGSCPPPAPPWPFHIGYYPFAFLTSNGQVFFGGAAPAHQANGDLATRFLSTQFEQWSDVGTAPFLGDSAVMYKSDWIMKAGGRTACFNGQPVNSAARIHAMAPNPTWEELAPMNHGRYRSQLVTLADGKVLVVGGQENTREQNESCGINPAPPNPVYVPVQIPELYNPAANTWTDMAAFDAATARWNHSVVLLLPDGRVIPPPKGTAKAFEVALHHSPG